MHPHCVILPSPPSSAVFQPNRAWSFSDWSFCLLFDVFLWFPYILFPLYYFCFDFPLYFVFVGFPCICFSISMYCFSLFVLCVFWFLQFCQSSSLLFRHSPSTVGPFSAPLLHQTSNASFSVWGLLARDQFYFPVFYYFFACNKSCLDRLAFGCDAWFRSLGCGCEYYPGFWVEEDKCWPEILSLSVNE